MYNRYIRNDQGVYTRISEPSMPRPDNHAPTSPGDPMPRQDHNPESPNPSLRDKSAGSRPFNRSRPESMDAGDLFLLAALFLLFREQADEEILTALGLLLIL